MSKRLLVIDGPQQGPFLLSLAAGNMTIGGNTKDPGVTLRDVHILRIHCEVEVEGDPVVVRNPETAAGKLPTGAPLRQELHPGEVLDVGTTHVRLEAMESNQDSDLTLLAQVETALTAPATGKWRPDDLTLQSADTDLEGEPESAVAAEQHLAKCLHVIDGADQGRFFSIPETGIIAIGKSHKHAEIVLNDLYVSRVHCELQVEGDGVLVKHLKGQYETLVNGKAISQQQMHLGDVLRVGNTHLRLETGAAEDAAASNPEYEILDEDTQEEAAQPTEEAVPDISDDFALPHAPVDQLLRLEEQTLGHFQIGSLLGRGQSSLVFRAQDLKKNLPVALKVLSPDFPRTDAEMQHFVQALKITPQYRHAHLVGLYGAGRTAPYCWIARELVEGESLTRLVTRLKEGGKFDWTRACRVAVHLGNVLKYLHEHNVTHGNISPRNILIPHGDKVTKLTDLMLNRALDGSYLQKAIVGKKMLLELPFLPPEQADPFKPVEPVGDLYSLGAVLYALLTGQPPFGGNTSKEILSQVREGNVVKPSKFQRGIPAPFEAAVLKMMARSPSERFQTAAEMLAVVEPIAKANQVKIYEGPKT